LKKKKNTKNCKKKTFEAEKEAFKEDKRPKILSIIFLKYQIVSKNNKNNMKTETEAKIK
jgi:hypothetical protein